MIEENIFNQHKYCIGYEFDVNCVDDISNIKDEILKEEISSLYKSIDEYSEQNIVWIIKVCI